MRLPVMTCALVERLPTIADPRRQSAKLKHPLVDMSIVGCWGVRAGGEDCGEIAEGAKVPEGVLGSFLALPPGSPAHDPLTRVFALLNPATLPAVVLPWL